MNANTESFLNLPTLFADMLNFVGNSTTVVLLVIRATRFPTTHTDSTYSYMVHGIRYVRSVLKNTPESTRSNKEQTPTCAMCNMRCV